MGRIYITILIAALSLASCSKVIHKQRPLPPVGVRTLVAGQTSVAGEVRYVGTVAAERETPLAMQVTGRVTDICCKEGDHIRKGQKLLCVDSTQAVSTLRAAEAALRDAEDGYNRFKQIHASGVTTDRQLVEVESKLAEARSAAAIARKLVAECVLHSPVEGTVSGMEVEVGQSVQPGGHVLTLLDVSSYKVAFAVPEAEIGGIAIGQTGRMNCAATDGTYTVRICEKNLKANPVAHTYTVHATILGDTHGLMPGMVATVTLEQQGGEHIVVPAACVHLLQSGASVWVVRNNRATRVMVDVGGYQANGISVTAGLNAGDTVVVEGFQKLYEGCEVTIY